jgi:hypothetical protein
MPGDGRIPAFRSVERLGPTTVAIYLDRQRPHFNNPFED